jgi:hypothetical protein
MISNSHTRVPAPAVASPSITDGMENAHDWRAVRVREWLLALLRFAITWNPKDETAALAMADEIDALGLRWRPSAPSFFRRTTAELCKAITAFDDPRRAAILKSHVVRIDDQRLRRAFAAAAGFEQGSPPASSNSNQRDLWAGLRS